MISVSSGRLVCVAPEPVTGQDGYVPVVVERDGVASNTLLLISIGPSPQVWQGTLMNEDGTPNDKDHPAAAGSLVSMLLTGGSVGYGLIPYWNGVSSLTSATVTAVPGYVSGVQRIQVKTNAGTAALRFAARTPAAPRRSPYYPGGPWIEDWELSLPVTVYVK